MWCLKCIMALLDAARDREKEQIAIADGYGAERAILGGTAPAIIGPWTAGRAQSRH